VSGKFEVRYLFNGMEVSNGIPEIGNLTYIYLKGRVHFEPPELSDSGGLSIDFRIPVSEKTCSQHNLQQLQQLTLELMRRAIQEEPLQDWFETQSAH